jgi:hypothetical protein
MAPTTTPAFFTTNQRLFPFTHASPLAFFPPQPTTRNSTRKRTRQLHRTNLNKHKSSNKKDAPLSNKKAVTVTAITNKIQECKIISQTPPSAAAAAEDEDEYADSDVDMPDVVTLDDAEPSGRKLRDINYDVVTLDETKVAASYDPKLLLQAIKVSDMSVAAIYCNPSSTHTTTTSSPQKIGEKSRYSDLSNAARTEGARSAIKKVQPPPGEKNIRNIKTVSRRRKTVVSMTTTTMRTRLTPRLPRP